MRTKMKELRSELDLTQEELAKIVGVRRETIVFLEKGKYNPSLMLAYRVAKALNSSIEDVFIFDD
jgi:putative transcriptional regulator